MRSRNRSTRPSTLSLGSSESLLSEPKRTQTIGIFVVVLISTLLIGCIIIIPLFNIGGNTLSSVSNNFWKKYSPTRLSKSNSNENSASAVHFVNSSTLTKNGFPPHTQECINNYQHSVETLNFTRLDTKTFGSRMAVKHYKFPPKDKDDPKKKAQQEKEKEKEKQKEKEDGHHHRKKEKPKLEDADKNPNAIISKHDLVAKIIDIKHMTHSEREKYNINANSTSIGKLIPLNDNCISNLPNYLEFNAFHKSGVVFSENIKMLLFRYCNIYWDTKPTKRNILYFKRHRGGYSFERLKKNKEYLSRKNSTVLLNFMRSPLDTIISGYNYHALCPKLESAWINKPISKYIKIPSKYRDQYGNESEKLFANPHHESKAELNKKFYFYPYYSLEDWNSIKNYSICSLHRHMKQTNRTEISLYYEYYLFTRRWRRFEETYRVLENKKDNPLFNGYNLRMENYIQSTDDFRNFINHLFINILNLKFENTSVNRDCNDYNQFMTLMEKNDIHFVDPIKDKLNQEKLEQMHQTHHNGNDNEHDNDNGPNEKKEAVQQAILDRRERAKEHREQRDKEGRLLPPHREPPLSGHMFDQSPSNNVNDDHSGVAPVQPAQQAQVDRGGDAGGGGGGGDGNAFLPKARQRRILEEGERERGGKNNEAMINEAREESITRQERVVKANINDHVTSYGNDGKAKARKEEQIHKLLTFTYRGFQKDNHIVINVCNKVKEMMRKTGYPWEYDQYC